MPCYESSSKKSIPSLSFLLSALRQPPIMAVSLRRKDVRRGRARVVARNLTTNFHGMMVRAAGSPPCAGITIALWTGYLRIFHLKFGIGHRHTSVSSTSARSNLNLSLLTQARVLLSSYASERGEIQPLQLDFLSPDGTGKFARSSRVLHELAIYEQRMLYPWRCYTLIVCK